MIQLSDPENTLFLFLQTSPFGTLTYRIDYADYTHKNGSIVEITDTFSISGTTGEITLAKNLPTESADSEYLVC